MLVTAAPEPGAILEYRQCLELLKAASAFETYRKFYRSDLVSRKIVQFLLFHNRFPGSVRFSTNLIRQFLGRLSAAAQGPETRKTERLAGQLAANLEFGTLEEVYQIGLSAFLSQVINQVDQITNSLARAFFKSGGYSDQPTPVSSRSRRPAIHVQQPPLEPRKAALSVQHQFTYRYESPVFQVRNVMRLAPPQHYGYQRRLDLRWHMDPPADYRYFMNAFGNLVWQLDHVHIEQEIACTVEMRIETQTLYHSDQSLSLQGISTQGADCAVKPEEFTQLTKLVDSADPLLRIARRQKSEDFLLLSWPN